MTVPKETIKISDTIWELPKSYKERMRVPARIYATESLLNGMDDAVFDQITNVAQLPGVLKYAMCMPDAHWGYGFPIGGVAAMDVDCGVISPGGIGFDINCGMRLALTNLTYDDIGPHVHKLVDQLFAQIPCGVGVSGFVRMGQHQFPEVLKDGARWCLKNGFGLPADLEHTEEGGCMEGADPSQISEKAILRGLKQLGTLGSGNHYLEIQVAKPENIFDQELAASLGITVPNQVVVMFHCGSRGFGHQVATDYLNIFLKVMNGKYGLGIIDRELACAPFHSPEGQAYFGAMKCAVNMAFANRQVVLHRIREVFSHYFKRSPADLGMDQVYDVCHNIAKLETHVIDGKERQVLVHRKGATRAFGPGMAGVPRSYQAIGQPVIIGGSMETGSYLLVGSKAAEGTFYSTAHGSGRTMSRNQARKQFRGSQLKEQMEKKGIYVHTASYSGLAEEAGAAYKNIDDITSATELAGISKRVARFVPIGNIKG